MSPYVDITMATPSLVSVANATGQKNFTLAFALGCDPQWGDTVPLLAGSRPAAGHRPTPNHPHARVEAATTAAVTVSSVS